MRSHLRILLYEFLTSGGWHAVGNWMLTLIGYLPVWLIVRKLWARRSADPGVSRSRDSGG